MMYSAATRLSPDDIYDAARMTFLEMALSGITTVGEFHYLHHAPDGKPYDDPNLLAKTVIRAALNVGIRIALLRVAYFRSGFEQPPNPLQQRFIEPDVATFIEQTENLRGELFREYSDRAWIGVAPHSIRAATLDQIREIAQYSGSVGVPLHMHVAEQPAEIEACLREYRTSPLDLLSRAGVLNSRFTGVHAIHITEPEITALAEADANICACPTTERNLGDGIIPADKLLNAGVAVSFGTDSHAQIDMFEEARELEYHLRLEHLQRNVLAPNDPRTDALAERLFTCATGGGARSLGFDGGSLAAGQPADFFSVDLNDPTIAGAGTDGLLAAIVFAANRAAVTDVVVGGKMIVTDGRHPQHDEIVRAFADLQTRLWN
jgi:formimidoylglutamate deiminase